MEGRTLVLATRYHGQFLALNLAHWYLNPPEITATYFRSARFVVTASTKTPNYPTYNISPTLGEIIFFVRT